MAPKVERTTPVWLRLKLIARPIREMLIRRKRFPMAKRAPVVMFLKVCFVTVFFLRAKIKAPTVMPTACGKISAFASRPRQVEMTV